MYYFIVNPTSGSGSGSVIWNTLEAELKNLNVTYKAYLLTKQNEAKSVAARLSELDEQKTIIVVGGDGTMNEVVSGLMNFQDITLGCIPTGSGNDFVRGLGLEKSSVNALHQILNPLETVELDIGTLETSDCTTSFCVSSGVGFDAAVCESVQDSALKTILNRFHSGKLVYLVTALWQILTMKLQSITITTDDGTAHSFKKAYFAAFMNLPFEGGGFKFAPEASAADGLLDLLVVDNITRLRALTILPSALSGNHVGKKGIHMLRCKNAAIHADEPLCVHTDGEVLGHYTDIKVSYRDEKLTVITG